MNFPISANPPMVFWASCPEALLELLNRGTSLVLFVKDGKGSICLMISTILFLYSLGIKLIPSSLALALI
jgi:hypothetical protein